MAEVPNRYSDPYWTQVASSAESKNGLPAGVLQSIVMNGEKSNNDQVSIAGARTPFQIIPETRDRFLKKYGVDAYLSPENAANVAALHIKESLNRGASVPRAIGEYNGGTNPARWDKTVTGYIGRVLNGIAGATKATVAPASTFQAVLQGQQKPPATSQIQQIYDAYAGGKMAPEDAAEFEADVTAGKIMLPKGAALAGAPKASTELPPAVLKAYKDGRMLREDMIDLEKDVAGGMWTLPAGEKLGRTEGRGVLGGIKEAITGAERSTAASDAAGDWAGMPELNQLSGKGALTALATMTTGPDETVKIIQSNYPGVKVRQDEKGNFLLKSSIDGKEYAFKPGFQASDIPRILGGVAAFAPAAKATTVLGGAAANAGTQAVIEGTQAAAGGDFDPAAVAMAGGVGGAVPAVAKAVQAVRNPAQAAIEQAAPVTAAVDNPSAMPDVFRSGRTGAPVDIVNGAATPRQPPAVFHSGRTGEPVTFENGVPVASQTRRATDTVEVAAEPAAAAPREASAAGTAKAAPEAMAAEDLGHLVQKASGEGMGAVKAQEELAAAARVNKDAMAAANRLGIELPADVFSDSQLVREAAGLTRSAAGSTASAAWRDAVQTAATKADEVIGALDASPNVAAVSEKVLGSLAKSRSDLETTAKKIYGIVNDAIPKTTKAQFPKLKETLAEIRKETPNSLTSQEKALTELIGSKKTTYGDLLREKDSIGKAMAGKDSPYGNMTAGALKRLYGALAEDQLNNVARIGGDALRAELRTANQLYAKKAGLEKRIIHAFGKESEGSIANMMRQAIEGGSKGDVSALNKLLKVVPEDLQKETVASALMSAARAKGGATRGDFGFSEFNKLYTGLRQNEPVYARVVASLGGKDAHNLLSDLNTVSKRITDARANVLTTGKANQALVNSMQAEGLVSGVLEKIGGNVAALAAYTTGGHWAGALLARSAVNALKGGKPNQIEAAGKMFHSPEFQKVMTEAATGTVNPTSVKKLALSSKFADFARRVNLPRELPARERWILQALESQNDKVKK